MNQRDKAALSVLATGLCMIVAVFGTLAATGNIRRLTPEEHFKRIEFEKHATYCLQGQKR